MQLTELTRETVLVGESSNCAIIAKHLKVALNGESKGFTHMEPIYGANRSGRILYQGPHGIAVRLSSLTTPEHAASEFEKLLSEARYRVPDHALQCKGWEVSHATVDGRRIAIVWAKWVEPEPFPRTH